MLSPLFVATIKSLLYINAIRESFLTSLCGGMNRESTAGSAGI